MKTALVAGSTGLVGSELLKLLLADPSYEKIHILVRKNPGINSSKLRVHKINFDQLSEFKSGDHFDHIFCTLGTTIKKAGTKENFRKVDFDYVFELGKKAKEWGSSKFLVVSSLGANAGSQIFYSRVKGEIEKALIGLDLPGLYIFRPSLLFGNRTESRVEEKTAIVVYKILDPLFIGRLKRYRGIKARQVAEAMIRTATSNNDKLKIFESDEIQNL
jgi:uncharacterized protein YbjT (DUF2867 family)